MCRKWFCQNAIFYVFPTPGYNLHSIAITFRLIYEISFYKYYLKKIKISVCEKQFFKLCITLYFLGSVCPLVATRKSIQGDLKVVFQNLHKLQIYILQY